MRATGAGNARCNAARAGAHPSPCPPFTPFQPTTNHPIFQEVPELSTREVLIIHHTDCGAQAAL